MQIEKQKQDSFETMIVLMENILEDMIKADRLSHQQKANWEDLVGALFKRLPRWYKVIAGKVSPTTLCFVLKEYAEDTNYWRRVYEN